MAAPDTSTYVLYLQNDQIDLPNSRMLVGATGIALQDNGTSLGNNNLTIVPVGNLLSLYNYDEAGYLNYDAASNTFIGRSFASDQTILIDNPDGVSGQTSFSVVDSTSIQNVNLELNGILYGNNSTINFIPGANVSIGVSQSGINSRMDVSISATGGGGGSGTVTSVSGAGLINVASGTTTPVISITPGTNGQVITTNGSGAVVWGAGGGSGGGTVTSVAVTGTGATVTGSPITTSGTINITVPNWSTVTATSLSNVGIPCGIDTYTNNTHASLMGLTNFAGGVSLGENAITNVGYLELTNFSNTPSTNLRLSRGIDGTPTTYPGLAISDGTNIGQVYDDYFNPPTGGGGGTVTSVAVTGTGASITGSPITTTGTINITVPNWSTVTGTSLNPVSIPGGIDVSGISTIGDTTFGGNVSMNENGITDIAYLQLNPLANTPGTFLKLIRGLDGTPTTYPGIAITDGTHTGQVYDDYFNPPPSGGGGVPGAVGTPSSGATINFTLGNITAPVSIAGNIVISGETPDWGSANNGSNIVIGTGGTGLGQGATTYYSYSTIIGSGTGQLLTEGQNAVMIGNSVYGTSTQTDTVLIGSNMFNQTGTLDTVICIGQSIAFTTASSVISKTIIIGGDATGAGNIDLPNGLDNAFALGYSAAPLASNTGILGFNTVGATTSFKVGIGTNAPAGTLHLGSAGSTSTDETSIWFNGNSNAHVPAPINLPPLGMILAATPTGAPLLLTASSNIAGTQVVIAEVSDPSGFIKTGDMLCGSANPPTGTGTDSETGYFDVIPISSSVVGQVWTSTGTTGHWAGAGTAGFTALPPSLSAVPVEPTKSYVVPDNGQAVYNITLPAVCPFGQQIVIVNFNAAGVIINFDQPQVQLLKMLNDVTAVGITLSEYCSTVTLLCVAEDLEFVVIASTGNVEFN